MATAISATDLTKVDPLKTVPPTVDVNNYQSIIDGALNGVTSLQTEVEKGQKVQAENIKRLTGLQTKTGTKTADQQALYDEFGVNAEKTNFDKYNQELNTINSNITGLSNEAKAIPLQIQEQFKNTGATDRGVAPIETGKLRENAIKALTQSALADIVTSNIQNTAIRYNAAKEKADRAVDLKYEPIETEIANLKEQLALNKTYITDPAEKKLLDAQTVAINERARLLTEQKETEKTINSIKLEVAKNNPSMVSKLDGAKTVGEAIAQAGDSLRTPNTEIVKLNENQAYLIDKTTGKIIRSFGGGSGTGAGGLNVGGTNSQYADVVNTILASGKFTKDQATAVRNAINNGEDPLTVVKNNAKNLMGSTLATDLDKKEGALEQLAVIDGLMKEYYASGGKTNIFSGKYEQVLNKVGAIKDPKIVEIATKLSLAMQAYRLAVTGTAASVQEDSRIDAIFPGITNGEILNNTKTQAVMSSFQNDIDKAYGRVVGEGTYQKLKGVELSKAVSKGSLSDRDFVAKAFEKTGQKYDSVINATPEGQIPVVDNKTGQIGYIPWKEYDASIYTKL